MNDFHFFVMPMSLQAMVKHDMYFNLIQISF